LYKGITLTIVNFDGKTLFCIHLLSNFEISADVISAEILKNLIGIFSIPVAFLSFRAFIS